MEWFGRAWRGEEKLWKVFWIYYFLIPVVVNVAGGMVLGHSGIGVIIGLLLLVYIIAMMICVWKCAWNTDWKGWGYIARIWVCLAPVLFIAGLVVSGALIGQDLVYAAECRQAIATAQRENVDPQQYIMQNVKHRPEVCLDAYRKKIGSQ